MKRVRWSLAWVSALPLSLATIGLSLTNTGPWPLQICCGTLALGLAVTAVVAQRRSRRGGAG